MNNTPNSVELDFEAIVVLEKLIELRKVEKELKAELEAAKKSLYETLGSAEVGTVNGVAAVRVLATENTYIDKKKLLELDKELYNQTLAVTPYTKLMVL